MREDAIMSPVKFVCSMWLIHEREAMCFRHVTLPKPVSDGIDSGDL